jgi:hypothetical protein
MRLSIVLFICLLICSCSTLSLEQKPCGSTSSVLRDSKNQLIMVLKQNNKPLDRQLFMNLGFSSEISEEFSRRFSSTVSYLSNSGSFLIGRTEELSDGVYFVAGRNRYIDTEDTKTNTFGYVAEYYGNRLVRVDLSTGAIITFIKDDPDGHQVTIYNPMQSRTLVEAYSRNTLLGYKLTFTDFHSVMFNYRNDHTIDPVSMEKLMNNSMRPQEIIIEPTPIDRSGDSPIEYYMSDTEKKRTLFFSKNGNCLFASIAIIETLNPRSIREYAEFRSMTCTIPDFNNDHAFCLNFFTPLRKKTIYTIMSGNTAIRVSEYSDFFASLLAKREDFIDQDGIIILTRYSGLEKAIVYHDLLDQDTINVLKKKHKTPPNTSLLLSIEEKKGPGGSVEYNFLGIAQD